MRSSQRSPALICGQLHRPVRRESLAGDFQTELVESAERGQVSAGETRATSSVRQVEVSQMAGVRTAIIGETSTPFQGPSTPGHYTLNRGEPHSPARSRTADPVDSGKFVSPAAAGGW